MYIISNAKVIYGSSINLLGRRSVLSQCFSCFLWADRVYKSICSLVSPHPKALKWDIGIALTFQPAEELLSPLSLK